MKDTWTKRTTSSTEAPGRTRAQAAERRPGNARRKVRSDDSALVEDKKMRRLRIIVDLTAGVLAVERLTIDEALDMVNATKHAVLGLFPGKEETYDMIYGRRFARIMRERFAAPPPIDRGARDEEPKTRA